MKVKHMVFSLLFGAVFAGGAAAYYLFVAGSDTAMEVIIIIGIFGLAGAYAILATVFNIIKLILLKESMDGTGTYLNHEEKKHLNRKVDYAYWVINYSYTDERGKNRKSKHYVQSEADAVAFQQKGKFPIKFRGRLSSVK